MRIYATSKNLPVLAFQWKGNPNAFEQNKVRLFTHTYIHEQIGGIGINRGSVHGYYFNPKAKKLYWDKGNPYRFGTPNIKGYKMLTEIHKNDWIVYDSADSVVTKPFYTDGAFRDTFNKYVAPKNSHHIYIIDGDFGAYSDEKTKHYGYTNTEAKAMIITRNKNYETEPSAEGEMVDNAEFNQAYFFYTRLKPIKSLKLKDYAEN